MTFTGGTMRVIGVCMCDTSLMPSVPCENNNMPVDHYARDGCLITRAWRLNSPGMTNTTMLDKKPSVGTLP